MEIPDADPSTGAKTRSADPDFAELAALWPHLPPEAQQDLLDRVRMSARQPSSR